MDSTAAGLRGELEGTMPPTLSNDADDLVRDAKRLRFSERAVEEQFRAERLATGGFRLRVRAVVGIAIVAILGWIDYRAHHRASADFAMAEAWLRAAVMAPSFLLIAVAPALPGYRRWADGLNAAAIILICWASGLMFWHLGITYQRASFGGQMVGAVVPILVISVFGLPIGFRAMAAMVGLTVAGILAWCWATLGPDYVHSLNVLSSSLLLLGGAALLLGWWRDRAERTMFAQREQVRRLASEFARVNAEQTTFMGIAAHDLRAPLATVRGYAELLRKGRLPEGEPRQHALREIETQSARMLALVSDYLGAHAAAGRAEPAKLTRIDLSASARAAVGRHAPAATAKVQTLACADGPPNWAQADEARLAQVVDNFVANALKFSPRGGTVRVAVEPRGANVRLAVRDEGPGIAPEELPGLFRMFGRGSARPTGGETSHGLGLAVAKRLAESMGGAVGCESEPGRGATFWIELPTAA